MVTRLFKKCRFKGVSSIRSMALTPWCRRRSASSWSTTISNSYDRIQASAAKDSPRQSPTKRSATSCVRRSQHKYRSRSRHPELLEAGSGKWPSEADQVRTVVREHANRRHALRATSDDHLPATDDHADVTRMLRAPL